MAQYKDGNEKMAQSGGGLEGFDRSNFHEFITRDVCKYYFILDDVLKDRPNVKAWYTNEEEWDEDNDNNDDDDDDDDKDEHMNAMIEDEFNFGDDSSMESNDVLVVREYESNMNMNTPTNISTNTPTSNMSLLSDDNNSTSSTMKTSDDLSSLAGSSSKRKQRSKPPNQRRRISPLEAKIAQKKLTRKRNKTIAKKKGNISNSTFATMDKDERELTIETRDAKMSFEREKHKDLRTLESEKLTIEKERLQLEKDNMLMKREQIMAQKEQIQAQTNLEKSHIVLLKMDMFKSRQAIKKDYPDVTDEYLNTHFPYPE